jgi:hypothetical protein
MYGLLNLGSMQSPVTKNGAPEAGELHADTDDTLEGPAIAARMPNTIATATA